MNRFITAFDHKQKYPVIVDKFIKQVKDDFPEYYQNWDPYSILINDSLQLPCVEVLSDESYTNTNISKQVCRILYQSRLIKKSLSDFLKEESENIEEELLTMFAWYCQFTYSKMVLGLYSN